MSSQTEVQYVSDSEGHTTGVLIPIELWRQIASERETAYLLSSPAMRQRLLDAMASNDTIPIEDASAKLGI